MSDSNRYSCSQSRCVTITPHPLYGGAEGNRTPVRNSYMFKTFLRNRELFGNAYWRVPWATEQTQGVPSLAHLHHLILSTGIRKTVGHSGYISFLIRLPNQWCVVLVSICLDQAATLSATKAANAGWIITTVSTLSFQFCLSLEADSYLRVLNSQNPVETLTAPYWLFKVLVGTMRFELMTSRLSVVCSTNWTMSRY